MYLELTRNGLEVHKHFEKFESPSGPYYRHRAAYMILDIELRRGLPVTFDSAFVPGPFFKLENYLCFVRSTNSLYRGKTLIATSVSHFLPSPLPFMTQE
jgi:hypothetical protein